MRPRIQETVDDDEDETLSSDGSDSEKSFLGGDSAVHRAENRQNVISCAGPLGPDAILPRSRPERGRSRAIRCKEAVAWRDMPKKSQLIVITLARLSEPLTQTSLQSYMYYQLKWFDPSLPDSAISSQAGMLHASFTAAQFLTALVWGRVADSTWFGRKSVILLGLTGTLVSCIGFGFATSFYQALLFRSLGGVTNGNVGVLRTMISETVREKKYQARAFILLPMCFNIGVIIGPILGGILSDPAGSYPETFGDVEFFRKFPYALPNLASAVFICCSLIAVWMFLEETHEVIWDRKDYGLLIGRKLSGMFGRRKNSVAYTRLHSRDMSIDVELSSPATPRHSNDESAPPTPKRKGSYRRRYTQTLPFRRIFTFNVVMTFVAHFFLAFGLGTFNSLWTVFLSTPVYNPNDDDHNNNKPEQQQQQQQQQLPFRFTGGLGLSARKVGAAMALLGGLGILLQLGLYPNLSARLGTLRSYRLSLACFPLAYAAAPYLSLVPSSADSPPPSGKAGFGVWAAVGAVLLVQVLGRTFALPGQTILANNCSPHPSVLGTVHGFGVSVSSFARAVGPAAAGGWLYGYGLRRGCVGAAFWCLAGVALCGCAASCWLREGDGHEIWLEGDEEEEEEVVVVEED